MVLRGDVVRVAALADGDFHVAVRLDLRVPANMGELGTVETKTVRRYRRSLVPVPGPVAKQGVRPALNFHVRPGEWISLALLATVVCLVFSAVLLPLDRVANALNGGGFTAHKIEAGSPERKPDAAAIRSGAGSGHVPEDALSSRKVPGKPGPPYFTAVGPFDGEADLPTTLAGAQALLVGGRLDEAAKAFDRLEQRFPARSPLRIQALLGRAQALGAAGRRGDALAILHALLQGQQDMIPEWRDTALRLERLLDQDRPRGLDDLLLTAGLEYDSNTSGERVAGAGGYYIDVDKRAYVLSLFKNGRLIKRYPVGLGLDDSTPAGLFRVANKITHPDWYHRGKTIPAGDPRNPLGASWMGLGNEKGPTSYGIHPTQDVDRVGSAVGPGCVRMRPDDAAELFKLCPIGTPVRIRS